MDRELMLAMLDDIGGQFADLRERSGLTDASPENSLIYDLIPQIERLGAIVHALANRVEAK